MNYDDDVPTGYGSLGGEATDHHDAVKTKVVGEGVQNALKCDKCGQGLLVVVPWPELIYMSMRTLPPNNSWLHDAHSGCFVPNARCTRCGDPVRLGMTPDECGRHIKSGILGGKVSEQAVQGYVQQIQGQGQPRRG